MSVLPSIAPRRRTFTPHVLLFLGMAALSLAYLTFVGMRPDLVAMWRQKPNDAQAAIVETQRNVERALADLDPIKQGVGEMKMEVDNMQHRHAGSDGARPPPARQGRDTGTRRRPGEREGGDGTRAAAGEEAGRRQGTRCGARCSCQPLHQSRQQFAAIETGSIEQKKAAAPAKPAPVGVLLATGPSVDALRLSWSIINDRHGAAVKELHPRYVVSGKADERTYGLVAGPLETVADAKAMCKTMTENGVACEVSQYRGNAF